MTELELRNKIEQQLDQLPAHHLLQVSHFLNSLQTQKTNTFQRLLRRLTPIKRRKQAGDLLKFAGTWQGNDLGKCLQFIKETRSQKQF